MNDDKVFKALADPSRRKLLDLLFQHNGQTLSDLQIHLDMTRFGCMKHLQVLEEAGLLTTQKVGREKHHYLNPVPIQLVYDRWVSKYAQPWAQALTGLKYALERQPMEQKHTHVFEIFIRTTPEQLWQALTDGSITPQYYFGSSVQSTWQPGATYTYPQPNGGTFVEGEVLEIDPPRRLVTTFRALWREDALDMPTSKVTWQIEPVHDVCKLTMTHDDLVPNHPVTENIITGWSHIISGLKTLLETGQPLMTNA
ncbi:MAG: helix-turn-helix domain-containing protein [Chloroflexaceae bacterium]|nr:helix-turn-helix domain-containing protein [Chloroflexaceae bacterium]NJO07146.1 helix-turn-helix domain-containing protein [Chloroflexaceae bacterium]